MDTTCRTSRRREPSGHWHERGWQICETSRCSYKIPRCAGAASTHALKAFSALVRVCLSNSANPVYATPVWPLPKSGSCRCAIIQCITNSRHSPQRPPLCVKLCYYLLSHVNSEIVPRRVCGHSLKPCLNKK